MYWNAEIDLPVQGESMININMRCIEILIDGTLWRSANWLTLTWDVLKSGIGSKLCIYNWININMRCIEINMSALVAIRTHGLTLTWDVLK